MSPAVARLAPYQQNLTPTLSPLHPHCLAKDWLWKWIPTAPTHTPPGTHALGKVEQERIKDTMLHVWEEETRLSYGAGLLMWHCSCDSKGLPKAERAPVSQALLSAFIAHMASAYSGKTISSYLHGVQAWHILHGLPWVLEKMEMDTMLWAADKLTPTTSKRAKHHPYTPEFISAIQHQLDLNKPLDTAVFACLTTCFYALARLGEFTVQTLSSFDPNVHVTTQNLLYDQDRNNLKVTVLHLPRTKSASIEGEDVYWASQNDDTDPTAALEHHLQVNQRSTSHQRPHICSHTTPRTHATRSPSQSSWRGSKRLHAPQALNHCRGTALGLGPPSSIFSKGFPLM